MMKRYARNARAAGGFRTLAAASKDMVEYR